MKRELIICCLAMCLAGSAIAQQETKSQPAGAPAPATEAAKTNAVLGVEKFMKNVDRYPGRVQVEGIVKTVSAKNQSLGLVDVQGCEKCEAGSCAELVLPVRWVGAMAPDGSLVVSGQAARGFLDWYTVAFETTGAVRWEAVRDGGLD